MTARERATTKRTLGALAQAELELHMNEDTFRSPCKKEKSILALQALYTSKAPASSASVAVLVVEVPEQEAPVNVVIETLPPEHPIFVVPLEQ
jgi:hypothetical protein